MTDKGLQVITKPNTLWDIVDNQIFLRVVNEETKQIYMVVDWPILEFFEHIDRMKAKYFEAQKNKLYELGKQDGIESKENK